MRTQILTDIHANLEALTAVLAASSERGYDQTVVLGDVVGYGPDPNAVIERVQALAPVAIIRGNHDKVACGIDRADGFNSVAKQAAHWTYGALTPEHRDWLAALPHGPVVVDESFEICHGSPFDEDAYVFDELDALRAFKSASRPLCFFGHTHYPVTFELMGSVIEVVGVAGAASSTVALKPAARYLINPGSVGQPRDSDPRAAFAILDDAARRLELYRVRYPAEATHEKVARAGLPDILGHRLTIGR